MDEPLETWFKREVLAHEEILMRFLSRVWPRHAELADIRQEAYARVYEAALTSCPKNAKAFLFTIARHLMADRVRRERIVSIQAAGENEFLNVLIDELSPERKVSGDQELIRLAHAFDRLPEQCRKVVWLRRVKEFSQKEVARRLGLNEKTVEKHLAAGGRLLVHYMRMNTLPPRVIAPREDGHNDHEIHHEHEMHPDN
jgi:RNA polymerase sigma-70 factor (ECF subfamily)